MEDVREYLNQFSGGAVTVETNPLNGLAIITISNPAKLNAISGHMMVELHDRIRELESWDEGKAVILRGEGGNFCSGGDLEFARASGGPEGATAMNQWMLATLAALSNLPLFSVCLLEGPTLGGGTEISLACDYILAAENVRYGVVHGRLGIVTAWGGGTRLVRRIGKSKALDLLLTSRMLSAKECVEFGIADAIVSSTNAMDDAECWLSMRLQHHCIVTRAMKRVIVEAATKLDGTLVKESHIVV